MKLPVIFAIYSEGLEEGVARLGGTETSSRLSAVQHPVAGLEAYHRVADLEQFELLGTYNRGDLCGV